MKSSIKDLIRLQHIKDAIELVEKFSKDVGFEQFAKDLMMQNAVVRQFEIIGEASSHISDKRKGSYSDIHWEKMRDFRNLLTHEYFRVDAGEVWSAIENDLPIYKEQIQLLIENLKDDEPNS